MRYNIFMSIHTLGIIYAVGAAVAWGLAYTIDQKILLNTSPLPLLFVSLVVGAILILPVLLLQGSVVMDIFTLGKTQLLLVVISVALATFANYLIFASIEHVGASLAAAFEISYPFFVFFFSYLIYGAQLNIYVFLGSFLIFAGSAIIMRFG